MRRAILISTVVLAILTQGCTGNTGTDNSNSNSSSSSSVTSSSSSTSSTPIVINGHTLPPEPDETLNNSTLLGIDSNNNGVRDDVEIWIYTNYKDKHPIHIDIAMQAARAYKKVLEEPERAAEITEEVSGAFFCSAYYQHDAKYLNEPTLISEHEDITRLVNNIYFNTKERTDTYWQYDTLLSGGVYTIPWSDEQKAMCDFNTSKYEE